MISEGTLPPQTITNGGASTEQSSEAPTGALTSPNSQTSETGSAASTTAAGGETNTGETTAAGGETNSGGTTNAGGQTNTGGTTAAGGETNPAETTTASGETNPTGTTAAGGETNSGGTTNAGGETNSGGTTNAGGQTNPSGTTAAGGETNPVETTTASGETNPAGTTTAGDETNPGETTTAGGGTTTAGGQTNPGETTAAGGETNPGGTTAAGGETNPAGTTTGTPNAICTAINSGDFNDAATWEDGQIPSGACSIVILSGVTVTFTGSVFNIKVPSITISGSFIFSSTIDITFEIIINIIIEAGGSLQDQTSQHQWNLLAGSTCTFYSGSSFTGSNTMIYVYTVGESGNIQGASFSFGSSLSGPFTFAIILTGEIQTFTKVTFIAGVSGGFGTKGTWLGGIVPTADFCASIGGCGLYISSGCNLDTSELGGELNINFNAISIASGGTFSLGSTGSSTGFRFLFNCQFNIFGILNFVSSAGGLYLPFGSAFNLFGGAQISSSIVVEVRTYDVKIGGVGTIVSSFTSSFSGTFYVSVSVEGVAVESSEGKQNYSIEILNHFSSSSFRSNSSTGRYNNCYCNIKSDLYSYCEW